MSLDPDLAAVLGAIVVAGIPGLASAWRRRRALERACAACGRRIVAGVRSCDCTHLASRDG